MNPTSHSKIEPEQPPIFLASGSAARQTLLKKAGLSFEILPANIDEYALLELHRAKAPTDKALILSCEKALAVSREKPGVLVIGSDQILCLGDKILNKARNRNDALEKLRILRGKTHRLVSGVAVARDGEILWQFTDTADLTMRDFDETFLHAYARIAGDALTDCAGAYQIEGAGAWLFSKIDGDYFTIMGMPLPALLGYLFDMQGIKP